MLPEDRCGHGSGLTRAGPSGRVCLLVVLLLESVRHGPSPRSVGADAGATYVTVAFACRSRQCAHVRPSGAWRQARRARVHHRAMPVRPLPARTHPTDRTEPFRPRLPIRSFARTTCLSSCPSRHSLLFHQLLHRHFERLRQLRQCAEARIVTADLQACDVSASESGPRTHHRLPQLSPPLLQIGPRPDLPLPTPFSAAARPGGHTVPPRSAGKNSARMSL
jgi:hypothetical protein